MIFLSHNQKDKPVVEQVAMRLAQIFGSDNVFYDAWSIQPGDSIIGKMNEGLEKVQYFFLFVSANSLSSEMVKLEWQTALMKATSGRCKIIPVRLDESLLPGILMQTLYLDLYNNGLEITIRQIVEVVQGKNIFQQSYLGFSNMEAFIEKKDDYIITFNAKYFMEPTSMYLICVDNEENDLKYEVLSDIMSEQGFNKNVKLNDGKSYNAIFIAVERATTPKNPVVVRLSARGDRCIQIRHIMKGENKKEFHSIPIKTKTV